jgi:hypothetical protein
LPKFVTIAHLTLAWALLIPLLACEPPEKSVDIKAEVYTSRTEVKVKNADNFDWSGAEVGVALTATGPFYSKKIGLFAKGDTRTVALNDMDNSGERFNPYTQKAAVVYVKCQTPQGRGWWSASKD